jgi:hypothetical protein
MNMNMNKYQIIHIHIHYRPLVAGHTRMGYEVVFPSLQRIAVTAAGKKHDDGAVAAKIGWLEGNQVFGIMGAFFFFFSKLGLRDGGRGKRGGLGDWRGLTRG